LLFSMKKIIQSIMRYFRVSYLAETIAIVVLIFLCSNLPAQQETEALKVFRKHSAPVKALAFSADGKTMASGGDDKMIYFWNLETGELTGSIQNSFTVKALRFTSDDNILAACGTDIKLMDRQGELIRAYSGYTTDIWSISYNKTTQRITAGSYAKTIRVWDFNTGKSVLMLKGHERSCLPVCFSPSGSIIASGSLDKSVRLWDAVTGQEKNKLELHSENIFALDFHPSGKYVVSASADKTIRLWNVESGKIVRTYSGHTGAIFDVQFSPDGNHMISCGADKTIILWETATGKKLYSFIDHTGIVNSVRYSIDGGSFASASDDHTVRFWRLEKKYYLAESYFEKEIEETVSKSPLFAPRGADESRQDYSAREIEANKFLDGLYDQYYLEYLKMLKELPIE
jgi:dipeptidyl aminopeptidase/acylaminoacyl peptidase